MLTLKTAGRTRGAGTPLSSMKICLCWYEWGFLILLESEEHTRAVRQVASLEEHQEANFFLSGGSQLLAGIQRYGSSLTNKGVDIKSCCTPLASPKAAVLTATVPGAGKDIQNHTDALSKATQRMVSVPAWTSPFPTVIGDGRQVLQHTECLDSLTSVPRDVSQKGASHFFWN